MEMTGETLVALARAIGYPEDVPSGAERFSLKVDDATIEAAEASGRLVLSTAIAPADEVDLAAFAGYAAGRALKEDAVLAYDAASESVILWQALPVPADASLLRRFFEVFTASCDWWRARVEGAASVAQIPEMMIRP